MSLDGLEIEEGSKMRGNKTRFDFFFCKGVMAENSLFFSE